MTQPLKIFCDFDGTITHADGCNIIIDRSIGRAARQAIDDKIVSGEYSFRQGYSTQFDGVNMTWAEAKPLLHANNGIDPTFVPFVKWVQTQKIPFTILSGGVTEIIREYLATVGLTALDIRANHIRIEGHRWFVTYFDDTPHGNDKAAAVREAARGFRTVFIGDGISDFAAAGVADILFAKRGERLENYCISQGIDFYPFDNFEDVQEILKFEIGREV